MGKNKATKVRLDAKHYKKTYICIVNVKFLQKTLHMQDNIVEIGKYILQPQKYRAFIPHRFPPAGRIEFNDRIAKHLKAIQALSRLDGVSSRIPDMDCF